MAIHRSQKKRRERSAYLLSVEADGKRLPVRLAGLCSQQEQVQRPRPGLDGPDTVERRNHPDLWQALEDRGLLQDVQVLSEARQRDEFHLLRHPDRSHGHCLRTIHDAGATCMSGVLTSFFT